MTVSSACTAVRVFFICFLSLLIVISLNACVVKGLGSHVRTLDQIRAIERPLSVPMLEPLALDLLWSDPTRDESDVGIHANPNRGAKDVVMFGPDVVREFCLLVFGFRFLVFF